MIWDFVLNMLKLMGGLIILGVIGVIVVAGIVFLYTVFEDIHKTNKNNKNDTVQFQNSIRPEEENK